MEEKVMCVSIKNLRTMGYSSFQEWYTTPLHVYIGKGGRISTFSYPTSKFNNPFTPFDAKTYELHILSKIKSGEITFDDITSVYRATSIGCRCEDVRCHASTLLDIISTIVECREKVNKVR